MQIFFYILLALLLAYGILIEFYRRSWNELTIYEPKSQDPSIPYPFVSVIIAARNEEKKIGACLDALLAQDYPPASYEIIVVNDHSTDQTETIIRSYTDPRVRLINLSDHMEPREIRAYKKKAIETGIARSTGEWIMCTDADCRMSPSWIPTMASMYQEKKAAFIAAPVQIEDHPSSLLTVFQCLDFISLQGITGAAVYKKIHSMCNGANLGYRRRIFDEVNGFLGIDQLPSGDDMLLMHKMYLKEPGGIFFLKNPGSIVYTEPVASWKAFFNQRIRWASKAMIYQDKRIVWILGSVFLLNLLLLCFFLACFWQSRFWPWWLAAVIVKGLLEFPFVWTVSRFFRQSRLMKYFFFMQPLHIFYTVIAGAWGNLAGYEWKGRRQD